MAQTWVNKEGGVYRRGVRGGEEDEQNTLCENLKELVQVQNNHSPWSSRFHTKDKRVIQYMQNMNVVNRIRNIIRHVLFYTIRLSTKNQNYC